MIDRSVTITAEPRVPGEDGPSYDLDIVYVAGFGWVVWQDGEQWNDGFPFRSRKDAADEVERVLRLPRYSLRAAWRR